MALDEAGLEDASILLMSLGEEEAAAVLRHLSPREVRSLGETIARMTSVPKERLDKVMAKFASTAESRSPLVADTGNYVRNVLKKALDEDKANLLIDRILQDGKHAGIEGLIKALSRTLPQDAGRSPMKKIRLPALVRAYGALKAGLALVGVAAICGGLLVAWQYDFSVPAFRQVNANGHAGECARSRERSTDASAGRIDLAFVRTGDSIGASGSGLLAGIQFDAVPPDPQEEGVDRPLHADPEPLVVGLEDNPLGALEDRLLDVVEEPADVEVPPRRVGRDRPGAPHADAPAGERADAVDPVGVQLVVLGLGDVEARLHEPNGGEFQASRPKRGEADGGLQFRDIGERFETDRWMIVDDDLMELRARFSRRTCRR